MTKCRIFFRADASATIGYGHFIRTLALADMLKDDFDCTFFTQSPSEYQQREAEKVCPLVSLPSDESKFNKFFDYLKGDEIVVLDNYFFTSGYQRQIKGKGCKLVCIDDMHDKHYYADIVINHATGLCRADYDLEPYTQLCTGLNWSLLRKEFIEYQPSVTTTKNDIFVCFGGSDFCNITTKVLEALSLSDCDCTIHVVLGEANKQREYLIPKYQNTKVKFYSSLTAQQMIDIMSICKVGVLPASGLLWESLYVGLPSIFGFYVDNQIDICLHNPTIENSICIGDYRTIDLLELADQIKSLYNKQLEGSLVNNRNVKDNYIQLFHSTLTCRRATADDCDLYFTWANDPVTRSMAFNKEPIPYENHCKWFSKKTENKDAVLYLFYSNGIPVGQVRFDIDNYEAEIDISIDREQRGKNIGTTMLKQALFWFSIEKPGIIPVSKVLIGNPASHRIFEKCGFTQISENKEFKKYEFHYSF